MARRFRRTPQPPGTPARRSHALPSDLRRARAAHAARLLHRDLKSSNILLDATVQPVNRAVSPGTGWLRIRTWPTPPPPDARDSGLSSPERWAGEPASTASDIFALGLVLHEIYTGSRPSLGPGDPRMATRLVSSSVPASIRAVITRCLEPDPSRRFPSAEAVAAALAPAPNTRRDRRLIGPHLVTYFLLALPLAHAGGGRPSGRVPDEDAISPRMPPNYCAAPASVS
jgi:serine/threonine-protein kinase